MKKIIVSAMLVLIASTISYASPRTYSSCAQQVFTCADGTQRRQDTELTLRSCIQQFRGCYLSLRINENKSKTSAKPNKKKK